MAAGVYDRDRDSATRARPFVLGGAAALMVLPLLALRGLDPAAWDMPGDAVFLAILLCGTAVAFEFAVRVPARSAYPAAVALALAAALLHLWINLAVGIIGSEDNPANLLYFGVVAVAALGALLARFRPAAMATAMAAAAAAQVATLFAALAAGLGFTGPVTVFFAALWLASSWLFRRAAA